VIFELQLGQVFFNLIVRKLTIVNSQFTKLPNLKKLNLAVMHTCSYYKHEHCYLMIMMIKYFAFFKPWTYLDGTHTNEEQNQNHEVSIGLLLKT